MLQINAISIVILTKDGVYGYESTFKNGLNIVRGNNTSGKSSLFQGILYCLGVEEIFGARNTGGMQSIYKEYVSDNNNIKHSVIESYVMLEIKNNEGEVITLKRYILNEHINSKLVKVYAGGILTGDSKGIPSKDYYLHDAGAATNENYGFHQFLCTFIGWNIEELQGLDGNNDRIYIQQIVASFFIEQLTGWSDFLACAPHYSGIVGVKSKIIEFILNLDVVKSKKVRNKWLEQKSIIEREWFSLYEKLDFIAKEINGQVEGATSIPEVINDFQNVQIILNQGNKNYTLDEYIPFLKLEIAKIDIEQAQPNRRNFSDLQTSLNEKSSLLIELSKNYEDSNKSIFLDRERLNNYEIQLIGIEEDLEKNKGALKIKKYGAELESSSLDDKCPICLNVINDTLLPNDINYIPMGIEENISYLDSQRGMLKAYISNLKNTLEKKEYQEKILDTRLLNLRQEIRYLKKELISDERLPSITQIERKTKLEYILQDYQLKYNTFIEIIDKLEELSEKYLELKKNKPKDSGKFSNKDRKKLTYLESIFKECLGIYGYQSESINDIGISYETYLPIIKIKKGDFENHIKINSYSSASDMIRSIWAYSVSLMMTSNKFGGNHPGILIFDEPKQQDLDIKNFHSFLENISLLKSSQIITLASFEGSDETYYKVMNGIDSFNSNISPRLIKKTN